jgi:pimeloyl-ACP methyl ester carboxylesterase
MTVARAAFELVNRRGDPLRGDVWRSGSSRAGSAIVICHGFKGFKDWGFFPHLARELAARTGYPTVAFNFAGSGIGADLESFSELERFAHNTFSRELDDLGVVLDATAAGRLPGIPARRSFGLLGHSRGGGIAVLRAAADRRVEALVTWSAIASVDRWNAEQKEEWRRRGRLDVLNVRTGQVLPLGLDLLTDIERNAGGLNICGAAARLRIPYLIIHGTEDESVSFAEGERLAAAAPRGTTCFEPIAGAGHTFGAVHPFAGVTDHLSRAIESSVEWLARNLGR